MQQNAGADASPRIVFHHKGRRRGKRFGAARGKFMGLIWLLDRQGHGGADGAVLLEG